MMKKYPVSLLVFAALALCAPAPAMAADCAAIGQKVAVDQGGELIKSTPSVENGNKVCVVVVLVYGANGEKPSRVEVAVPVR